MWRLLQESVPEFIKMPPFSWIKNILTLRLELKLAVTVNVAPIEDLSV